jgi:hypothetical protein
MEDHLNNTISTHNSFIIYNLLLLEHIRYNMVN